LNQLTAEHFGAIRTVNPRTVLGYKGETDFKIANNVIIRNGTISRTSLSCIGGFDNRDITLYDLVIKDWESVCVTGLEHEVSGSYKRAVAEFTLQVLKCLYERDPKACVHNCALDYCAVKVFKLLI